MRIECPICKKVLVDAPDDFGPRPFCSTPCKMVDLGNWLGEVYRIPVSPFEEPDADTSAARRDAGLPLPTDTDEHTLS